MYLSRLPALTGLLLAAGCGGPSGSNLSLPFSGSWTGISLVFAADSGTALRVPDDLSVTVDAQGKVTGSWHDAHGSGKVGGSIDRTGVLDVTFRSTENAQDTVSARGNTILTPDGRWQGSLPVSIPAIAGLQLVWAVQRG